MRRDDKPHGFSLKASHHERCGKGITLTEDESRNLYDALKAMHGGIDMTPPCLFFV